jgi:hypothetical protein
LLRQHSMIEITVFRGKIYLLLAAENVFPRSSS